LKVVFGQEIRRISLPDGPKYDQLIANVQSLFDSLGGNWTLKFKDDEGDLISITNDLELEEALSASKGGILRLQLIVNEEKIPAQTPKEPEPSTTEESNTSKRKAETTSEPHQSEPVHSHVFCDACKAPVRGIRYKCANCPDYDLCQRCENKGGAHDPEHLFLKIYKPLPPIRTSSPLLPQLYETETVCVSMFQKNKNLRRAFNVKPCKPTKVKYLSRFMSDETIKDGSAIAPGHSFVKIWKVRNCGTVAWPRGTRLVFIGGATIGKVNNVAVPPVNSGEEISIAVDMVAPRTPGRYVSNWCLCEHDGTHFGSKMWADIKVVRRERKVKSPADTGPPETRKAEDTPTTTEVAQTPPVPNSCPTDRTPMGREKKVDDDVKGEWRDILINLYNMGFTDRALNREVLVRNKGDMLAAVHELISL